MNTTPIDLMVQAAQKRVSEHINRSAGQHLRAMRAAALKPPKESK